MKAIKTRGIVSSQQNGERYRVCLEPLLSPHNSKNISHKHVKFASYIET